MDINTIITYVICGFQAVGTIVAAFAAVKKLLDGFTELKKNVEDSKDYDEMRQLIQKLLEDNYQLKEVLLKQKEKEHPLIKAKED